MFSIRSATTLSLLFLSLTAFAAAKPKPKAPLAPPKPYVDEGACPFECCIYRDWSVLQSTEIFDKAQGKSIGKLAPGDKITAVTGTVYVIPTKMRIVFAHKNQEGLKLEKGKNLYLLTRQGEGYYRVWYEGKTFDENVDFIDGQNCPTPSEACWLRMEEDNMSKDSWWVKLKLKTGKIAWAEVGKDKFGNMDTCE